MKKEKKSNLYTIIGIIVLVGLGIGIFYLININKLDTDDELVQEIYSYIGNNDLQVCGGLVTYDDKQVSYDELEQSIKLCMAYSLTDSEEVSTMKIDKTKKNNTCSVGKNITFATDNYEDEICTITKIESDKVNEQYKKMYGKEIDAYDSFNYDETTTCYYEDGNYYCGLAENYTYTVGAEPHTYRSIKKAKKSKDEIIIYDYFLKLVNDECYTSFTSTKKDDNCTKNYDSKTDIDYKFLKKNGSLYKHTFKKDKDTYYWVSSEPAK